MAVFELATFMISACFWPGLNNATTLLLQVVVLHAVKGKHVMEAVLVASSRTRYVCA